MISKPTRLVLYGFICIPSAICFFASQRKEFTLLQTWFSFVKLILKLLRFIHTMLLLNVSFWHLLLPQIVEKCAACSVRRFRFFWPDRGLCRT